MRCGRSAPQAACPGELHKLGARSIPAATTRSTAISCMGYEIAGGLGVKMAQPDREVFVMVGDGSYLMMNSEIATSVAMGLPIVIVVLDNHGFWLHQPPSAGSWRRPFNNLLADSGARNPSHHRLRGPRESPEPRRSPPRPSRISSPPSPGRARRRRHRRDRHRQTDPARRATAAGGAWWDVAVPAASARPQVERRPRGLHGKRAAAPAHRTITVPVRLGINPIGWTNDDMPESSATTHRSRYASEPRRGLRRHRAGRKFPRAPRARCVRSSHATA